MTDDWAEYKDTATAATLYEKYGWPEAYCKVGNCLYKQGHAGPHSEPCRELMCLPTVPEGQPTPFGFYRKEWISGKHHYLFVVCHTPFLRQVCMLEPLEHPRYVWCKYVILYRIAPYDMSGGL